MSPPHSLSIFQCVLLPPSPSAFPILCALPEKPSSLPSVPSHLSQLASSRKCYLCLCLHLKSQQPPLFNNCPAASNTEPPPPTHTKHAAVGSSDGVISSHTVAHSVVSRVTSALKQVPSGPGMSVPSLLGSG